MEYTRNYSHRTHGQIGNVTFEVPKGKFKLNGTELPETSVAHLMTFALQTLQDAYAGATNLDECIGAFNGKLDKLLQGTIGTRGAGDGADERTRVARSVVFASLRAKFGAKSPEWKEFTGRDDAAQNARLDEIFAEHEEAFAPEVEAEMERRREKAAAKKSLAETISVTL